MTTWSQELRENPPELPSPEDSSWGPLVIGPDVDDAVVALLRRWMGDYCDVLVTQRELDFELEHPRSYETAFVPEELLDHMVPGCIVETARLQAPSGDSRRRGQGVRGGIANITYEGDWRTDISLVVRGQRGAHTRLLAGLYEGAARRVMLDRAHGTPLDWHRYLGMEFEEIPGDRTRGRYLLRAISHWQIRTDEIVRTGPRQPEPEAISTHVDVESLGLHVGDLG